MKHLQKLETAQSKYSSAIGSVEQDLKDKIEFDFSVQWQPSDGWTIVSEASDVAPFDFCIKIIEKDGFLSEQKFKSGCI